LSATKIITASVAALLLAAATAYSQIPAKLNYQVMLTDDADQPLADQTVTMVFSIFDVESGGAAVWSETHSPTTNSIGVVSVILGSITPVIFDFDLPLWLEVEVDGETLSPRRTLTAAPYAGYAAGSSDSERLGNIDASEYALLTDLVGTGDGHSLDADDGSPTDALYVDASGHVGIGTTSPEAELHVRNYLQVGSVSTIGDVMVHGGATGTGGIHLQGDGYDGGRLELVGGNGFAFATLGHSSGSGDGGKLWLSRDNLGTNGIWADADYSGTGSARMDITGASETISFNLSQTGDPSVMLPLASINSYEITDEPGVASAVDASSGSMTGSVQVLEIRSISSPSDAGGYILAIGSVNARIQHNGSPSIGTTLRVGISDDFTTFPASQNQYASIAAAAPNGQYNHIVTVHGLFTATAGQSKTFRLLGERTSGTGGVWDSVHLTLLYIPTARGTIETIDVEPAGGASWDSDLSLGSAIEGHAGAAPSDVADWPEYDADSDSETVTLSRELLSDILDRLERLESRSD